MKGCSDEALLETYDEERRPVFASTAADFIENYIEQDRAFLGEFDPERDRKAFEAEWERRGSGANDEIHSYAPNYAGSSIVYGLKGAKCSAKGDHRFTARPGHHLAPAPISGGGNVFELLSNDFTLLEFAGNGRQAGEFERSAERMEFPLKRAALVGAELRDRYDADLVLVRPDHFVAWTGSGTSCDTSNVLANCGKARTRGRNCF